MTKAGKDNSINWRLVVVGLAIFGFCVLVTYNVVTNWREFLRIPIYHCINLIVAIFFGYILVQKMNDERKLKDIVLGLIDKIQLELNTDDAHTFNECYDKNAVLMKQRKIGNKLTLLMKYKDKLNFSESWDTITKNFDEYETMFGDYMENIDMLKSHQREFQRIINIIEQECDKIKVQMFS